MKFTGERFIPSKAGVIALQHYHRYEFALHLIDFKGKTVLDIACGEGYGSNILSSQANKVYGVDISEEAIQSATRLYSNKATEFLTASVTKIPLPDNSIDIVVSFETIEHHDMHVEMMMEIKRVLKDNGILIISSPDKKYYETNFPNFKNDFHVKELYKHELEALLKGYFKNLYFFAQNNVFGSVITSESDYANEFTMPLHFNKSRGTTALFESRFIIVVASDIQIKPHNQTSFFTYSPDNDPFAELEILKDTITSIYQSKAWKLISFFKKITNPLRRLIKHDL